MSLFTTMMESFMTVTRPTIGRDVSKGVTQTPFTTVALNVPCSVQPASANIIFQYAQKQVNVTTRIYTTTNVGAEPNDVITVNDNDGTESIFHVKGQDRNLYGRSLSPYFIDCEKVK